MEIAGWSLGFSGVFVLTSIAIKRGHALTPFPKTLPIGELVLSDAYRFVRHPVYFGILPAALGVSLCSESL